MNISIRTEAFGMTTRRLNLLNVLQVYKKKKKFQIKKNAVYTLHFYFCPFGPKWQWQDIQWLTEWCPHKSQYFGTVFT